MAHKTTRRGGRRWFGKSEAKAAGKVTRRRDDEAAERAECLRVWNPNATYPTTAWCKNCDADAPVEAFQNRDAWVCDVCFTETSGIEEWNHRKAS